MLRYELVRFAQRLGAKSAARAFKTIPKTAAEWPEIIATRLFAGAGRPKQSS